ncbi:phosphorylase family protein [Haladaptatus caseinilyticus]|uniref:phosphorylase family protein n=1 Tax=Haladaptatus caseinilyticus TaxID=2993314 RepID=UPI00224B93D8|nr:phosphorylase [Haladaptatus caseinilyticus]
MTKNVSSTELQILLLPAFADDDFVSDEALPNEIERWFDAYDFSSEIDVSGANMPVFHTDDGIGITATGMGKSESATTVAAILASPKIDCSNAYFLTVGVAGTTPEVGTLGSVFIADAVVDWDCKQRWAERDDPDDDRTVQLLPYRPRDYVYRLNEALVEDAYDRARDVTLRDSKPVERLRNRYSQPAAREPPSVGVGATLCGDEFWHGKTVAEDAQWLVEQYDAGTYATTEMEEYGTATALDRFGLLHRYLSIRSVVNFDRPHERQTVRESLATDLGKPAVELGMENTFRVGSRVVEGLKKR